MILAHSVMGKGVSFMENNEEYHGSPVKMDRIGAALVELGAENDVERLLAKRKSAPTPVLPKRATIELQVAPGTPITYPADHKGDNRSAWGKALVSVAEANLGRGDLVMAVFDCDLAASVKTGAFAQKYPDRFFQFGITEHSTAITAGSLSTERALSIFSDFAMFGIVESYNQERLNDINHTNLKLVCTHAGVNVGEDGKTHQCIDYFGLLNSTFGWKVITPADPNQTDRVVRHVLSTRGNFAVVMGRANVPTVTDESGRPFFGEPYTYRYGRMEIVRPGEDLALVAAGSMITNGLEAWKLLADQSVRFALVALSDWSDLHPDDLAMLAGFRDVVVLEDHIVKSGLGCALGAALAERRFDGRLTRLGITEYASSGRPEDLYKMMGLDGESVAERIRRLLEKSAAHSNVTA